MLYRVSIYITKTYVYLLPQQHWQSKSMLLSLTWTLPKLHTTIQTKYCLKWNRFCLHCNLYSLKMAHSTIWNSTKIVSKTHLSSWDWHLPIYLDFLSYTLILRLQVCWFRCTYHYQHEEKLLFICWIPYHTIKLATTLIKIQMYHHNWKDSIKKCQNTFIYNAQTRQKYQVTHCVHLTWTSNKLHDRKHWILKGWITFGLLSLSLRALKIWKFEN